MGLSPGESLGAELVEAVARDALWDEPNHERPIPKAFLGKGALMAPFCGILGANDAIHLAVVGVGSIVKLGGKSKANARDFSKIAGLRAVVCCEVDRANLDPEVKKWRGGALMLNLLSLKRILARGEKGTQ